MSVKMTRKLCYERYVCQLVKDFWCWMLFFEGPICRGKEGGLYSVLTVQISLFSMAESTSHLSDVLKWKSPFALVNGQREFPFRLIDFVARRFPECLTSSVLW